MAEINQRFNRVAKVVEVDLTNVPITPIDTFVIYFKN